MTKLSVLIFSKDDTANLANLIDDVYGFADQLVIMDSSSEKNYKKLLKKKRAEHLSKIKIHRTIALGYPDPLRMYGLKKCRYEWILYLDTDEMVSPKLKHDIKRITSKTTADGFTIRRLEDRKLHEKGRFFTWQTRLYKKDNVMYKGTIHEQAQIAGITERLGKQYYLLHFPGERRDYGKMEVFERFSYKTYNRIALEYLAKIIIPKNGDIHKTIQGRIVATLMDIYEKITFRDMDSEISAFDYFVFFTIRDMAYSLKLGGFANIFRIVPNRMKFAARMGRLRKTREGKMMFALSQIIENEGIIGYLGLDDEKNVEKIYKKYKGKREGTDLLIDLLVEKYKKDAKGMQ